VGAAGPVTSDARISARASLMLPPPPPEVEAFSHAGLGMSAVAAVGGPYSAVCVGSDRDEACSDRRPLPPPPVVASPPVADSCRRR
jgi:hypothetical protein